MALKNLYFIIKSNIKNFRQSIDMSKLALKKLYSGTVMGNAWAIIKPLVFIFVYWFGIQVGIRGGKPVDGDIPFILWLISGILPWFLILEVLMSGVTCVKKNAHLVTKIVFPVETIPIFNVISYFNAHFLLLGLITTVFVISGYGISIYFLQIIYYLLMLFIFGCILCTFISTLAVISKDVQELVKSTNQAFFWLSPIIWNARAVRTPILQIILKANPIYYFVEGYRNVFVYKEWFFNDMWYQVYFWIFLLVFALITAFLQVKLSKDFSDVL